MMRTTARLISALEAVLEHDKKLVATYRGKARVARERQQLDDAKYFDDLAKQYECDVKIDIDALRKAVRRAA